MPYIIVIGDNELKANKMQVVIRAESTIKEDKKQEMTKESLINRIKKETKGMPFRKMYMQRNVSKRPIFVAWSEEK